MKATTRHYAETVRMVLVRMAEDHQVDLRDTSCFQVRDDGTLSRVREATVDHEGV